MRSGSFSSRAELADGGVPVVLDEVGLDARQGGVEVGLLEEPALGYRVGEIPKPIMGFLAPARSLTISISSGMDRASRRSRVVERGEIEEKRGVGGEVEVGVRERGEEGSRAELEARRGTVLLGESIATRRRFFPYPRPGNAPSAPRLRR